MTSLPKTCPAATANEPLSEVSQQLRSLTAAAPAIYQFRDRWVEVAGQASFGQPDGTLFGIMEEVVANQEVTCVSWNNRQILLVPIELDYQLLLAAMEIDATDQDRATVAVCQWRQLRRERDQLNDLKSENDGLVRQVSEDLEELTFLRQIADHLELAGDGVGGSLAKILSLINHCVKAQQVLLLKPNQRQLVIDDFPVEDRRASSQDSDDFDFVIIESSNWSRPVIDVAACNWLIDQFGDRATCGDLIVNHFDRTLPGTLAAQSGQINAFMLTPLMRQGQMLGWILTLNRNLVTGDDPADTAWNEINSEFGTSESMMLKSAATMLSTHLMNMQLMREKEELLTNTVRSLVTAIEAKDDYTRGHSERVAMYARRLGGQLGFSPTELERLYLSGLLHDVGKIGISDDTLGKPTTLNDDEYDEIKRHPEKGWAILHELTQLNPIIPGVLHHHERVDGMGYPDKLAGDDIPIDGRILAVVDAFDGMTSDRPYRSGMPVEQAVKILKDGAGTQWDAELIEAFLGSLDDMIAIKTNHKPAGLPVRKFGQAQH